MKNTHLFCFEVYKKNKIIQLVFGTLDLLAYPKQKQDADHVEFS